VHYYAFNIGDYTSHTAHLSPVEDIAYRRLLDLYYQTETPIQNDIKAVCRQIRMRDHEDDVVQILSEFFTLGESGWFSARCDREIAEYKAKAGVARANGRKGGRPSKQSKPTNNPVGSFGFQSDNPDETHEKANHKPLTNNQEPVNTHSANALPVCDDLPEPHQLARPVLGNSHELAGVVCKAIKATGVGLTNPSNPKLNALLHAGVTVEQFVEASTKAVEKGKNFSYALGILEKEEKDARDLATHLAKPKQRQLPAADNFSNKDYGQGIQLI
jgi:uncharacterized protein YdaU (DUF1376 family)